eukprot:3330882-Lingulodinium_polyedra.AAC.1
MEMNAKGVTASFNRGRVSRALPATKSSTSRPRRRCRRCASRRGTPTPWATTPRAERRDLVGER